MKYADRRETESADGGRMAEWKGRRGEMRLLGEKEQLCGNRENDQLASTRDCSKRPMRTLLVAAMAIVSSRGCQLACMILF